jgi:hypothetical protein
MKLQFLKIEASHTTARKDLDFEMVAKIEMGRCKLN